MTNSYAVQNLKIKQVGEYYFLEPSGFYSDHASTLLHGVDGWELIEFDALTSVAHDTYVYEHESGETQTVIRSKSWRRVSR